MNKKFMSRAIELSIESVSRGTGPFGAVIVKDNKIIAEGFNTVTSTKDPTSHAEIVAIRSACKELNNFTLKGYDLYTTCEPCPMCLSAIYWARIDRIYYANTRKDAQKIDFSDSMIYEELNKTIKDRKIPMHQ
ncbi:MAG: tRNA-specific adenosine deaminase, partial [Proteobacteria bacterium TMED261]